MKRLPESTHLRLPPVRLLRDDIEHLLSVLADGRQLELTHRGYSYDSLEELANHVGRDLVPELRVSASRRESFPGTITVHFEPAEVTVFAGPHDAERAALIAQTLRQHVPWYSWRPVGYWWGGVRAVTGLLLAWLLGFSILTLAPLAISGRIAFAALVGGFVGWASFSDRVWLGRTVVFLTPRSAQRTFWERNRDKILLSIVTSIVSGLVGFVLGKVLK